MPVAVTTRQPRHPPHGSPPDRCQTQDGSCTGSVSTLHEGLSPREGKSVKQTTAMGLPFPDPLEIRSLGAGTNV